MLALLLALSFQCPDGSPPPCRAASARREPALDDRTWLVLPFENTARAADAELIRQASVNLLYQEMSRWQDVRVISDDRVADLLQQLPAAQRAGVGLRTALDLARRVGANRLVLGDFLVLRGRATVTATVYDVRGGRQLRVVRDPVDGFETAAALDSLTASFARLSRGILALPAQARSADSGAGTSSIEAFRAYAAGMDAVSRFVVDSVNVRFDRAIALDSGFALARLRRWQYSGMLGDPATARVHLEAAVRLSGTLPARERALVDAMVASSRGDRGRLCAAANQLVAADSTSGEAWALLSFCRYNRDLVREGATLRQPADRTPGWRAAERAYALSPTGILSLQAMVDVLGDVGWRMACVNDPSSNVCPLDSLFRVSTMLVGDSVVVSIRPWRETRHAPPDRLPAAMASVQQALTREREIYERLALLQPNLLKLNNERARVALQLGDLGAADGLFGRGVPLPGDSSASSRSEHAQLRLTLALAQGRVSEASAWADSLLGRPNAGTPQYHSLFGRFAEGSDTSAGNRQNTAWRTILAGVLPPDFDSLERRIAARLQTALGRDDFLQLSTLAGFHLRRTGPALDTAARHPLKRFQAWFARGDTARARIALVEFDRELLARHPATSDDGGLLFSAESHLELGDSSLALDRMREFAIRWPALIQNAIILEQWFWQRTAVRLWGRAWLLYGDLAMARNQPGQARRAYRMVLGLWERGDPAVQPLVARARAALAQLQ